MFYSLPFVWPFFFITFFFPSSYPPQPLYPPSYFSCALLVAHTHLHTTELRCCFCRICPKSWMSGAQLGQWYPVTSDGNEQRSFHYGSSMRVKFERTFSSTIYQWRQISCATNPLYSNINYYYNVVDPLDDLFWYESKLFCRSYPFVRVLRSFFILPSSLALPQTYFREITRP